MCPGDGRGSLLQLVRGKERELPVSDADATMWRKTRTDVDMRRTTRGGGSAGQYLVGFSVADVVWRPTRDVYSVCVGGEGAS